MYPFGRTSSLISRQIPFGWSKEIEFSESDKAASLDSIDYWIDALESVR